MFILAEQRDADVEKAFARYEQYLEKNRGSFPKSAYALATSKWYFGFRDHKAPHDSWLESVQIHEPSSGDRQEIRGVAVTVRLLGAYHDGYIEFHYPEVYEYRFAANGLGQGHGDWRYDEFRVNDKGHVIHEIEWASFGVANSWLIEASDVLHKWIPK